MTQPLNAAVAGDTRLFAIVGDPIAQARSPLVFNEIFQRLGVNAVLVPMQIPAASLATAVAGLKCIGNLDGIRGALARPISVGAGTIAADHVDAGVLPQPRRQALGGSVRQQLDGPATLEIHEDRAVLGGVRDVDGPTGRVGGRRAACGRRG